MLAKAQAPVILSNASDPPPQVYSTTHLCRKSETSVLYVPWAAGVPAPQDRILVGYNDQSGAYTIDTGNNTLIENAEKSFAGYSYSTDAGVTWTRLGTFPTNPNCGSTLCPTLLRGDPWLARGGPQGDIIYYTNIAMTFADPSLDPDAPNGKGEPNAVAFAKSADGGITWSPMQIALSKSAVPGNLIDKESVSAYGNSVVVVAVRGHNHIAIATSDDRGSARWTSILSPITSPS